MYVISCSNFDFRIQIFDMCRTRMHTKKIREEKHVEKPAELQNIYQTVKPKAITYDDRPFFNRES